MNLSFEEVSMFTQQVAARGPDWDRVLAGVQSELRADPNSGTVIKGCGGLRKLRVGDPSRGQGKSGGSRIIYLYVPEARRIILIDVYDKNRQSDLDPSARKLLSLFADQARQDLLARARTHQQEDRDDTAG